MNRSHCLPSLLGAALVAGCTYIAPSGTPPATEHLAFVSTRSGNLDVYTMATDGTDVRRLTDSPRDDVMPTWSPDGSRLAYVTMANGNPDLAVASASGGTPYVIAADPAADVDPSWSPEGRRLAFVSDRGGQPDVYVVDVPSGDVNRVTRLPPGNVSTTKWSPRGDLLAFVQHLAHGSRLVVVRPDGTGMQVVSDRPEDVPVVTPAWSPDGTRLAYAAQAKDRVKGRTFIDLYVVDVASGVNRRLTEATGLDVEPAWSPDGRWIAFLSSAQGDARRQLHVVRPDGSDRHALPTGRGRDGESVEHYSPAWSADSRWIYFGRHTDDNQEIHRIALDGGAAERLTRDAALDGSAATQPHAGAALALHRPR
jgi:TolB protein